MNSTLEYSSQLIITRLHIYLDCTKFKKSRKGSGLGWVKKSLDNKQNTNFTASMER